MGRHSAKGPGAYPDLICTECATLAGKKTEEFHPEKLQLDTCDICKLKRVIVTSPAAWGHFNPKELNEARAKVKENGFDKDDNANPDDVRKLVEVVKGVLGANTSYMTKLVLRDIEHCLEHSHPIRLHTSRQLAYWYARDVQFLPKPEPKRKPRKKKVLVVESG
jgi:hypothetical protein